MERIAIRLLGALLGMWACVGMAYGQWRVTPEVGMNVTKYNDEVAKIGFKAGAAVTYTFGAGRFALQSGLYYTRRGMGDYANSVLYGQAKDPSTGQWTDVEVSLAPAFSGDIEPNYYFWLAYPNAYFDYSYYLPEDFRLEGIYYYTHSGRRDYLQLPVMARLNGRIGDDCAWHVAAGPYLALGLAGKRSYLESRITTGDELPYYNKVVSWNPFSIQRYETESRFDWGVGAEAGIEVRRVSLKMGYEIGFGKRTFYDEVGMKYYTFSFTAGYSF